jgi:type I restriction-modification system DNA methylase subunit
MTYRNPEKITLKVIYGNKLKNTDMQNQLEYTLNTTRKIYASGSQSPHNFYDIVVTIIAWNLLSNIQSPNFNITEEEYGKHSFSSVLKTINLNAQKSNYSIINEALQFWDNLLQKKLKLRISILDWEESGTGNLSERNRDQILNLWKDFFSMFPFDDLNAVSKLWESIENYCLANNNNEDAHLAPAALISTMTQYLDSTYKQISIYDPYSRTGNLLSDAMYNLTGVNEITGISSTQLSWKIANMRLLFFEATSNVHLNNYPEHIDGDKTFDVIISNPPYGDIRNNLNISIQDKRLAIIAGKSKRLEVVFLSHMLDRLSSNGKAAILLPYVFLTGSSTVKDLMEYILEQNILDIVIELPQGLFEHTAIAPVLFFFKKNRQSSDNVVLINSIKEVSKSGRQLYLDEKRLSAWIQQIKEGNIADEKKIITVPTSQVVKEDFNFYKLLHLHEKDNNTDRKSSSELLIDSEEIQNKLIYIQKEIASLIQNYSK